MRLTYDRGTLLLEPRHADCDPSVLPGALWDDRVERFRVPAHRYADVLGEVAAASREVDDRLRLRRTRPLDLAEPELRPYQQDALDAWEVADRRGLVVLPTGTGKTRVALAAIARVGRPALVLVPTRALLHQWARALASLGDVPVGRYGDGRHDLAPLTVSTFESALRHADRFGDCFSLLVVDEAHHFASGARLEALEMCAAPARLGLTATPPEDDAGLATLADAVGPVVYARGVSDFTGEHLAPFEHVSLRVALTPGERAAYHAAYGPFQGAWTRWRRLHGPMTWPDFVRTLGASPRGREILAGHHEAKSLVASARGKLDLAAHLLRRHADDRALVFTADNATAIAVSQACLVPAITCHTSAGERDALLEDFRAERVRALVSTRVLNEGLDVPEARVAIVLGGQMGKREHVQRVGRVLRPGPGKAALVFEVLASGTFEERHSRRRRDALAA